MRIEFNNVEADTRVISPRLKFTLELQNEASEGLTFFNFFGEVSMADIPKVLGKLTPEPFNTFVSARGDTFLTMSLDLDIHKINTIEELRKGKDLLIKLYVSTVFCNIRTDKPFNSTDINVNGYWVQQKPHRDRIKP